MFKGKLYPYSKIEDFANKNSLDLKELGEENLGQNFVVLENVDNDDVVSFILVGVAKEFIYECVYSDL